jgi:hypothetical protein
MQFYAKTEIIYDNVYYQFFKKLIFFCLYLLSGNTQ